MPSTHKPNIDIRSDSSLNELPLASLEGGELSDSVASAFTPSSCDESDIAFEALLHGIVDDTEEELPSESSYQPASIELPSESSCQPVSVELGEILSQINTSSVAHLLDPIQIYASIESIQVKQHELSASLEALEKTVMEATQENPNSDPNTVRAIICAESLRSNQEQIAIARLEVLQLDDEIAQLLDMLRHHEIAALMKQLE